MKMTCQEFVDRLAPFLAAGLAGEPSRGAAEHAASCRSCRDYAWSYRHTIRLARSAFHGQSIPAADSLVSRILAARGRQA
jgi:hypothetical protein